MFENIYRITFLAKESGFIVLELKEDTEKLDTRRRMLTFGHVSVSLVDNTNSNNSALRNSIVRKTKVLYTSKYLEG